jgi:hypothetical protein
MADSTSGAQIPAPSDLQPSSIDWAGLRDKATTASEQPTQIEPAQELTSESVMTPQEATTAEVFEVPEGAKVRVKIDGAEQVVDYKDFRDSLQREAVWTRRQQTFAQQKREAEEVLARQFAELQNAARAVELAQHSLGSRQDPLEALAKALGQKQAQEDDPGTIATIGDIQKLLEQERAKITQDVGASREELAREFQNTLVQLAQQQTVAKDAERYNSGLQQIFASEDGQLVSQLVPYADQIIRYKVVQLDPQSIEEGVEMTKLVVKELADGLKSKQQELTKKTSAQKASARVESPVGSAPAIRREKPKDVFTKDGKVDWKALNAKAMSYMD